MKTAAETTADALVIIGAQKGEERALEASV